MKNAISITAKGIKCDYCDYKNLEVLREDYEKWLNEPCPKCGENLLTEEDFEALQKIEEEVESLNKWVLEEFMDESSLNNEIIVIPIKADGSGSLELDKDNTRIESQEEN